MVIWLMLSISFTLLGLRILWYVSNLGILWVFFDFLELFESYSTADDYFQTVLSLIGCKAPGKNYFMIYNCMDFNFVIVTPLRSNYIALEALLDLLLQTCNIGTTQYFSLVVC